MPVYRTRMVETGSQWNGQPKKETAEDTTSIKGIKAATQMVLKGGTYTIDAEDDTLHSNGNLVIHDGTYTLSSGDDGIHADSNVTIAGGTIDITKSYEGIKRYSMNVTGGESSVLASDDGMNAAGENDSSGFEGPGPGGDQFASTEGAYIHSSGGILHVNSSGDGIDANREGVRDRWGNLCLLDLRMMEMEPYEL